VPDAPELLPGRGRGGTDPQLRIAGVDEAGRGPLAGPVVAAAVILRPGRGVPGARDSKVLSERAREALALEIREHALAWAVAEASVAEIDELNILQATFLAMRRAVAALSPAAQFLRVDGNRLPPGMAVPGEAIVRGDALEPAISCASILAKTHRDALMRGMAQRHPDYGFAEHFGYPTPAHRSVLERLGPCAEHRRSFAPVRKAWLAHGGAGQERPA
jgi:ribonuclease HII